MSAEVHKKLAIVMKECSHIAKNGVNEFHGYNYVTGADVLEKVNQAFTKVGLITTAQATLVDLREVPNTKGSIEKFATVLVEVSVYDIETEECLVFTGLGSGQDAGDKAIMKAQTAAIKYAYMMSLCIATNDDPEADIRTDVNMTMQEELKRTSVKASPKTYVSTTDTLQCSDCGVKITAKVKDFSVSRYGTALCMNCQKKVVKSA